MENTLIFVCIWLVSFCLIVLVKPSIVKTSQMTKVQRNTYEVLLFSLSPFIALNISFKYLLKDRK